jgi:hypothetical protein
MCLISKFEHQFPSQELPNTTCITYLQYWLNPLAEDTFHGHLTLLKAHFYFEKTISSNFDWVKIPTLLDEGIPDLGTLFSRLLCKATMQLLWSCQYYVTKSFGCGLNLHQAPFSSIDYLNILLE